ncbi:hypothetical protein D0C36_09720 [Mucilaginibacter conchicola]|uniref:Uncharacterized protein n=1 Tax=Mucilaginibacter conchicola TaxID=2303333 RepID=A0A372NST4_9SPHI|nr:hypothetical protein [Mucilaginibacter conchicola]RFZ91729.1 hypothetical protein D0C36_09720 [Mucilaginibacter conchicola]
MTFEEFFKKKRIDLMALQSGQPGLFSEFKEHYEAMGEKSFDHTKKYWFNKLRLQYHLAPEIKEEKVIIENRLAEQTIVESLTEPATASVGFKPRFKAGSTTAKLAAEAAPELVAKAEESKEAAASSDTETSVAPKPAGFKPRFNAKAMAPKSEEPVAEDKPATEAPAETTTAPKPAGFKPRFNTAKMAPKVEEGVAETKPAEEIPAEASAQIESPSAPKPDGFKPRFNAAKMAPKKEEPITEEKPAEETSAETSTPTESAVDTPVAPKPAGFKPRFNAAKMVPKKEELVAEEKPAEETTIEAIGSATQVTEEPKAEEQEAKTATEAAPKLGFKPRFNPKTTKPQPPKTED